MMACFLDLTEDLCCRAFWQYSYLIRGAVYGCLGRVHSSWGKVPVEELLLDSVRGLMVGVVQAVLGEEEEQTCEQEMREDAEIVMQVKEVIRMVVEGEEMMSDMLQQEEGEMGLDILFQEGGEMMREMVEGGVEEVLYMEVHRDEDSHYMEGERASQAEVASQPAPSAASDLAPHEPETCPTQDDQPESIRAGVESADIIPAEGGPFDTAAAALAEMTPPELGTSPGASPFPSCSTLLQRRGKNALRVECPHFESIPPGFTPQPLAPGSQSSEQSASLGVEACLPSEGSLLLAMVGGKQRIAQGESQSHVEGDLASHGESAVRPALSAFPPASPRTPPKPASNPTEETQQGGSRAAMTSDEIHSAERGIFSGDAFTPDKTPPNFGVFSGGSFTAEPLPSPSPREPPQSIPLCSPPQHVAERVLSSERAVSSAADLPSEGSLMDAMFASGEGGGVVALVGSQEPVGLDAGVGADLPSEGSLFRAMALESEGPDGGALGGEQEPVVLTPRAEALVQELLEETPSLPYPAEFAALGAVLEYFPELVTLEVLGQGGQGEVFRAWAKDSRGILHELAVKLEVPQPGVNVRGDFIQEGLSLAAIRSRFIIPCLGFTVQGGRLGLLFPLAWKPDFTQPGFTAPGQYLPPHLERVILFIIPVVAAVVDLHLMGFLHCDIKPENMMVEGGVGKLTDLGMAVRFDDAWRRGDCGTRGFVAPEVYVQKVHTPASDAFSVGMSIYGLLTGNRPWWGFPDTDSMFAHLAAGHRFLWPLEMHQYGAALVALVDDCWHAAPERRPTAPVLLERLIHIAADLHTLCSLGGP